ncbi:MAG: hypothetical protein P4L81_01900 [Candidatus Pacebacteria bacterium]|nr:hypothetical protein [Candidatus Paceibacterota bacterium]
MQTSVRIIGIFLMLTLSAAALIWYVVLREDRGGILTVSALPSGSIFVETPSGRSILVDGGADDSILRELGSVMPFYSRSIDVLVARAPIPASVGGFTSVLLRYRVAAIIRPSAHTSTPEVQSFVGATSEAQRGGTRLLNAKRGLVIDLGDQTYLEFLFPDRDASQLSAQGCLMFRLIFKNTSFFFACGLPAQEEYLSELDGTRLRSNILLGLGNDAELFLGFIGPQFELVPCSSSTSSTLLEPVKIQLLRACPAPVVFTSDGQMVTRE